MQKNIWLLLVILAALCGGGQAARADFYTIVMSPGVGTKITSVPYTINQPGFYYLGSNLTCASGDGITVISDDVTLDLMGFRLSGNISGRGISMAGMTNVEIRNGTLQGWGHGIYGDSGQSHRVINVRAEDNVSYGIMLSNGSGHLVKGCTIYRCTDSEGCGIYMGFSSTVSDNRVSECYYGIQGNGIISNNMVKVCDNGITGYGTISGNMVRTPGSGTGTGINCTEGSLIGNTVMVFGSSETGIKIPTEAGYPVMLDQNSVAGLGTHYSGGSAATAWGTNAGR